MVVPGQCIRSLQNSCLHHTLLAESPCCAGTKWSSSDLPQGWPLPPLPSYQQAVMQCVVQLSIPLSTA